MRLEDCIRRWLGMSAHRVTSVVENEGRLVAEIEAVEGRRPQCGCCGQKVSRTKGRTGRREWRDLLIRRQPLVLAYRPRRVVCAKCGVRVERVPWSERWSRVTRSLSLDVAKLARQADLSTVAGHYALNWKTVSNIIRRAVEWGLAQRKRRPRKVLGIDEVSRKKGHKYLTLVHDLERGELLWIGKIARLTRCAGSLISWARGAARRWRPFVWTCGRPMPTWCARGPRRPSCASIVFTWSGI